MAQKNGSMFIPIRPRGKASAGFTLFEILIVAIILIIAGAMVFPKIIDQAEKSKLNEVYTMISTLNRAQLRWADTIDAATFLAFTCADPPKTCGQDSTAVRSSLQQLGLKDFPQKNFKYLCAGGTVGVTNTYCYAFRGNTSFPTTNPRILRFYQYPASTYYPDSWHCMQGYKPKPPVVATYYSKNGCEVDFSNPIWNNIS